MKAKENKDFQKFQTIFKKYQKQFGLTGYKVYFKHEPLEDCYADITIKSSDMVVLVRLNKGDSKSVKEFRSIKQSAKHEAIHLLIHRLENLARCRYITEVEIEEATEELVFKLEDLIV